MLARATHVFRWDLDKTYLRTEFDTLRDLVRSALETAQDKHAYPGAPALLRALKAGEGHRVCIVSGSPSQMRQVLAAKLALDGIDYDEFVLKNNLGNLARLRFRAFRAQVPYKLPALLASRAAIAGTPPETLFGDDAEADAIIYCLYADILAGRVSASELGRVFEAARAYDDQQARTLALAARIPHAASVGRILIHLDRRSATADFRPFGARLVPIYNYFQAAIVLYADHLLGAAQVGFVAREMLESGEHEVSTLATSVQDLVRRGRIEHEVGARLADELAGAAWAGETGRQAERLAEAVRERLRQLGDAEPPRHAVHVTLDYVALVDAEFNGRRRRRR